MNKAILIGRLTKDPELKTTASGISVSSFTLAVNRRFKNADGNYDADFISCVAWRQQADFLTKYFTKGRMVGLVGSIQTRTYEDKDGNLKQTNNIKPVPEFSLRNNIWKYSVGFNDKTGHPAVFPEKLAEDHILSWSKENDVVLDPFMGSGTTAKMSILNNRNYIGFEISEEYCYMAEKRLYKYEKSI